MSNYNNNIEIEDYKGFTIEYDPVQDKFITTLELNSVVKSPKRGSLNDLRKEIDQFIKDNLEFKPFYAYFKPEYPFETFSKKYVSGIRKDGSFVIGEPSDKHKSFYSKKDMLRCCEFDPQIEEELKKIETEKKASDKRYSEAKTKLVERLKPMDLSMYQI